MLRLVGRSTRRVGITTVGATILLLGLLLIPLPGPGLLVVLLGLAVLRTEYPWASRALLRTRDYAERAGRKGRSALGDRSLSARSSSRNRQRAS
jgi:uncharacterized protein (TIGR02611 family)